MSVTSQALRSPFGAKPAQTSAPAAEDKPKTQLWINIGYDSGVPDPNNPGKTLFIAMPGGIPLESIKHKPIKGKGDYADMLAAGNAILDQVMAAATDLQPGEAKIIGGAEGGLLIELRRIQPEAQASAPEANKFMRAMSL